jgi:hypothetical protein
MIQFLLNYAANITSASTAGVNLTTFAEALFTTARTSARDPTSLVITTFPVKDYNRVFR